MVFCDPGWHAWDSPFGACAHTLAVLTSVALNIIINWLVRNSNVTCLDYKEGALERLEQHQSSFPRSGPCPVATTVPAADAAVHSLGICNDPYPSCSFS